MVKHVCLKCNAVFDRKFNYERHLNRVFECSTNNNKTNNSNDAYNPFITLCQTMPINAKTIPNYTKQSINNIIEQNNVNNEIKVNENLCCYYCKKNFSSKSTLTRHQKFNCKVKKENDMEKENIFKLLLEKDKQKDIEINELKKQNKIFEKQNKLLVNKINDVMSKNNEMTKIHKTIKMLETTIPTNTNINISNQYLEQIIQKDKVIEKLTKTNNDKILIDEPENNKLDNIEIEDKPMTLILNNDVIECRQSDGYINATQLCKAGGKLFADWLRLKSTKEYLVSMEANMGIPILDLINKNVGCIHNGIWIYPKMAIQLAQ